MYFTKVVSCLSLRPKSFVRFLSVLVLFLSFAFTLPALSKVGARVLFEEDFEGGNLDKWSVARNVQWSNSALPCMNGATPAEWKVVNGKLNIKISGPGCTTEVVPVDSLWNGSWKYYTIELDMQFVGGTDKAVLWRYSDAGNKWYGIKFITGQFFDYTRKPGGGSGTWKSFFPLTNGNTYHLKIEVNPDSFKTYVDGVLRLEYYFDPVNDVYSFGKLALHGSVGAVSSSEVNFDNVVVTSLGPDTIGPFELPFDYEGRQEDDPEAFSDAFWTRLNSVFDHQPKKATLTAFTGDVSRVGDCEKTGNSLFCYDSHTAVDFTARGGTEVFPVMDGVIVYSSRKIPGGNKCIPEKSGYGCVVIIRHDAGEFGTLYTQYAHLGTISALGGALGEIGVDDKIGTMGLTGRTTGTHLDLSVLKESSPPLFLLNPRKSQKFWKDFLSFQASNQSLGNKQSFCSYNSPLGSLEFVDPSGWALEDIDDPWGLSLDDGGCGVENEYLWNFGVLGS